MNSEASLMDYSPSLFVGLPSASSMSGSDLAQSFMNLDAENSIMALSGSNNNNNNNNNNANGRRNGGEAGKGTSMGAEYLPGKNLLGQVLDNANRSNSNSNNDASNGRGGRGGSLTAAGEGWRTSMNKTLSSQGLSSQRPHRRPLRTGRTQAEGGRGAGAPQMGACRRPY